MPPILRDPVWQFVAVILGFTGIVTAVVLYVMQRRRKNLSYEIISRTPLLSAREELAGRFQILFEGKRVKEVQMVVVRITNSGNVPITTTDYERPVSLDLGDKAEVLGADVTDTKPDGLEVSIGVKERRRVVLNPSLLNPNDSITLKLLVSAYQGSLTVSGRIVGVRQIRIRGKGKEAVRFLLLAWVAAGVVALGTDVLRTLPRWVAWILLILTLIILNAAIFLTVKRQSERN